MKFGSVQFGFSAFENAELYAFALFVSQFPVLPSGYGGRKGHLELAYYIFLVSEPVLTGGKMSLHVKMSYRKIGFETLFKQNLRFHGEAWASNRFFAEFLRGDFYV